MKLKKIISSLVVGAFIFGVGGTTFNAASAAPIFSKTNNNVNVRFGTIAPTNLAQKNSNEEARKRAEEQRRIEEKKRIEQQRRMEEKKRAESIRR